MFPRYSRNYPVIADSLFMGGVHSFHIDGGWIHRIHMDGVDGKMDHEQGDPHDELQTSISENVMSQIGKNRGRWLVFSSISSFTYIVIWGSFKPLDFNQSTIGNLRDIYAICQTSQLTPIWGSRLADGDEFAVEIRHRRPVDLHLRMSGFVVRQVS